MRRFRPSTIVATVTLAAFTAVFLWDGPPPGFALPTSAPPARDREVARFARCFGPVRTTCVVDGDTFWYRGQKVRLADINAPETGEPQCDRESELGDRATERLAELLNAGPFRLEAADRDRDRYGRLLRVVTRGGASLGETLVDEGLAEKWKGYRGLWC